MLEAVVFIGTSILHGVTGTLVFSRGIKKPVNQGFFIISICLMMWSLGLFMMSIVTDPSDLIWWNRIAFAGPMLLPVAFLYFSYGFPDRRPIPVFAKIMIAVGLVLFCLFPYTVSSVHEDGTIQNGWLATYVLPLYYLSYFPLIVWNFFTSYRRTEQEGRMQMKFFFFGLGLAMVISLTSNLVLPVVFNNSDYNAVGPGSTVFLVVFTMYAILKYRLFEVKLLAIETLIGIISLIFLAESFLARSSGERVFRLIVFAVFLAVSIPLLRAAHREQRLMRRQYEMMAVVSHQLRTPLTAIVGYTALLDEMVDPRSKEQKAINNLALSTRRLQSTVNDFLKLFELEQGKEIPKTKLALQTVIQSAVELLQNEFAAKGLQLNVMMPKKPVYVMADHNLLSEVISNLLHNAWRYTKEGHVQVNLSSGTDAVVTISDSGIGLTQREQQQLFQKFFRGKVAMRTQPDGSGLGLMIVREIIQMHGGSIEARSDGRNQGTTFIVRFPRVRE